MKDHPSIETVTSPQGQFALATPQIRIAPSILAADFSRLADQIAAVEAAGARILHLDVMDGHFVPNISFGVPVVASMRKHAKSFFDAHLMIMEPMRYAGPFIQAGCEHLTFHIEVTREGAECPIRPRSGAEPESVGAAAPERANLPPALAVIDHVRRLGASVGVALNPATPVEAVAPILEKVDLVLVMSVWPGFGGQSFMPEVLPKVEQLRSRLRAVQRLEIDGGIDKKSIAAAAAAGADTFVAGTAVFGARNPSAALVELHNQAIESTREQRISNASR